MKQSVCFLFFAILTLSSTSFANSKIECVGASVDFKTGVAGEVNLINVNNFFVGVSGDFFFEVLFEGTSSDVDQEFTLRIESRSLDETLAESVGFFNKNSPSSPITLMARTETGSAKLACYLAD